MGFVIYLRLKSVYGCMKTDPLKRLKRVEKPNFRLKRVHLGMLLHGGGALQYGKGFVGNLGEAGRGAEDT